MAEFLPLCDVLFNVISLAGYFCDVVFDVVMGYALLERGYKGTFAATMSIVITSLVISQVLSLRWYLHLSASEGEPGARGKSGLRLAQCLPILCHCLQLGVLWRYAKLFIPVDLRFVKHEVRNLCMLRLVHAFCEAAPMLLLQLHVLLARPPPPDLAADTLQVKREPSQDDPAANKAFAELNVISASLSLFSVCWALASFSKNVRLQNVHRLVLTWLGVIFQFLWRLGTISARVCALTVYALLYEHWVFLVIGLHWVSMFLWLISPKNVFHGERISRPRKAYLSALIAFVYVFAYVNLQELNHRQKMVTFYCVMLVENCLLVGAWVVGARGQPPAQHSPLLVSAFMLSSFLGGVAFMLLYYRYFHVRRLGYDLNANQHGTNSTNASKHERGLAQADNAAIPGVFNCRFSNPVASNGANCRKKKKPTSFVPPPAAPATAFWRRPLPAAHNHHGGSSENEGSSVGSRVNIQQKLQEKKQKQLAELRVIEEEIKQGKLATAAPVSGDEIYCSLQRQPIPRAKTHLDVAPIAWAPPSPHLPGLQRTIDTLTALAQPSTSTPTHHHTSYQNYPAFPQTCTLIGPLLGYTTYSEIKNAPVYDVAVFQNGDRNISPASQENGDSLTKQILMNSRQPAPNHRRSPYNADVQSRLLYDHHSPSSDLHDVAARQRNYLIEESRTYEGNNCGSPRNVQSTSPRTPYAADISSGGNSYERTKPTPQNRYLDKIREPSYEDGLNRQYLAEYSGDSDLNPTKYDRQDLDKDEYVSALQNALANVRSIDNIRSTYAEGAAAGAPRALGFPYKSKMEQTRKLQRCRTPEILLAPHYLEGCSRQVCCHWGPPYTKKEAEGGSSGTESGEDVRTRDTTPRSPSDIDSQISLPRSYTLPREFRYWRRGRPRRHDTHAASNNSSDGDVDSAGDNESDGPTKRLGGAPPAPAPYPHPAHAAHPPCSPNHFQYRPEERRTTFAETPHAGLSPDRRRARPHKGVKHETKL